MSTIYRFHVDPCGADLEVEHNLITPDTWTDKAASDKLIAGSGFVNSSDPSKLSCVSGPPDNLSILTLVGASWSSAVGDKGTASCDLCQNTPGAQNWNLYAIE